MYTHELNKTKKIIKTRMIIVDDDDCFYYHSWRNNVEIVFGSLSFFLTQLRIVSGVDCVVCPFVGDEKLRNIHVDLALLV